jgi:hypothetical protein
MNNGEDLRRGKVCEGKIVGGREGDDVAFAGDSFGAE